MKNKTLLGTICSMGVTDSAEIIALTGFDWLLIDMEHSVLSLADVQNLLMAAGPKLKRIVRVPGNDEIWIKRVLDTGCDGILVPMVKNHEEAARAVAAAKYPLKGNRSVGVTRAHGFGTDFSGYIGRADNEVNVMIQAEHIEAVNNIEKIMSVQGIGSLFIGPFDLSASMGLTGQTNHPDVKKAIDKVIDASTKAGIPWGIFGTDPVALKDYAKRGCTFLLCSIDSMVLMNAYRDIFIKLTGK